MSDRRSDDPLDPNARAHSQEIDIIQSVQNMKARRHKSGNELSLNINSLMDIMTILLVFLLLTITSDPLNISQGEDLRIARMAGGCGYERDPATNKLVPVCRPEYRPPDDSIPITITKRHIMVDRKSVVPVQCKIDGHLCADDDISRKFECDSASAAEPCDPAELQRYHGMSFEIDSSYMEDGDTKKFMVEPLHKELSARVKEHRELLESLGEQWKGAATIIADSDIPFRMIAKVIYTAGMSSLSDMRFAVLKTTLR